MTTNKNIDFAKLRAEHFGQWLDEAFQTMLEFLMDITDMWMNGQIIVSSQERGVNEKK